jgi:hypothetical protein
MLFSFVGLTMYGWYCYTTLGFGASMPYPLTEGIPPLIEGSIPLLCSRFMRGLLLLLFSLGNLIPPLLVMFSSAIAGY